MGKRSKTNLFDINMSYRLPILELIDHIINIITAVMLNAFSMPRTTFFVSRKNWEGRLFDDIMA